MIKYNRYGKLEIAISVAVLIFIKKVKIIILKIGGEI